MRKRWRQVAKLYQAWEAIDTLDRTCFQHHRILHNLIQAFHKQIEVKSAYLAGQRTLWQLNNNIRRHLGMR